MKTADEVINRLRAQVPQDAAYWYIGVNELYDGCWCGTMSWITKKDGENQCGSIRVNRVWCTVAGDVFSDEASMTVRRFVEKAHGDKVALESGMQVLRHRMTNLE